MKQEQLVPTRGTCERLKVAGFGQDTYFVWWMPPHGRPMLYYRAMCNWHTHLFAAPTAAELMDALPTRITRGESCYWLGLSPQDDGGFVAHYSNGGDVYGETNTEGQPAAEALALLWLEVKEKEEVT
jgi:hypothetical protein